MRILSAIDVRLHLAKEKPRTRFKELRRIQRAIQHRDTNDLKWAQSFCEGRIQWADTKRGQSYRRRILKRVTNPGSEVESAGR
jgi:hypothetical protein